MRNVRVWLSTSLGLFVLLLSLGAQQPIDRTHRPAYTPGHELKFPSDYREWIFLSSGSGMTYGADIASGSQDSPAFDNVFVNPASYYEFTRTGHWPDKTTFVLEIRQSQSQGSINHGGHFQRNVTGIEIEVKDAASPSGTWTFYDFPTSLQSPGKAARPLPRSASCYSCHATHGAVENTFVQFYPTLFPIAERLQTVNKPSNP